MAPPSRRRYELLGLAGAWSGVLLVRFLPEGQRSGRFDPVAAAEIAEWLCILLVVLVLRPRHHDPDGDDRSAERKILTAALGLLLVSGVLRMTASDDGGANIGLGGVHLVGLACLALGTFAVVRGGAQGGSDGRVR